MFSDLFFDQKNLIEIAPRDEAQPLPRESDCDGFFPSQPCKVAKSDLLQGAAEGALVVFVHLDITEVNYKTWHVKSS
jgi:hypothetical protein